MRKIYQVLTLSIFIITCFISCKEEDSCEPKTLDNELSFLVGKWEWVYSEEKIKSQYSNNYKIDTIMANTFSKDYIINIHESGFLNFFKGNTVVKSFSSCDVHSYDVLCLTNDGIQFHLYEKGISSHSITGCGSSNSNIMKAYTSKFIPLESKKDTQYVDYFIKIE